MALFRFGFYQTKKWVIQNWQTFVQDQLAANVWMVKDEYSISRIFLPNIYYLAADLDFTKFMSNWYHINNRCSRYLQYWNHNYYLWFNTISVSATSWESSSRKNRFIPRLQQPRQWLLSFFWFSPFWNCYTKGTT